MKDGKLACVGSPVELKHQYEVGYELLVRQRPPPLAPASPLANPLLAAGRPPPSPRTIAGPSGADGVIGAMQRASELNAFVLARVPGAVRYSAHPVPFEQRFTLPLAARPGFGAFLRDLEASSAEMHIDNYGISMAPFEEVCRSFFSVFAAYFLCLVWTVDHFFAFQHPWYAMSGFLKGRQ